MPRQARRERFERNPRQPFPPRRQDEHIHRGVPGSRVVPGADEVHVSAEAHLVDRPLDLAPQRSVPHEHELRTRPIGSELRERPEQCDWVLLLGEPTDGADHLGVERKPEARGESPHVHKARR